MPFTSNPRPRDIIDGFAIGRWVNSRRTDYRRGALPAERVAQLEPEFPDWQWKTNARTTFTAGLTHLRRYVTLHGTSSPPRPATIDRCPIGAWVAKRRTEYRRRRLPAERVTQLETEFPDWQWNIRVPVLDPPTGVAGGLSSVFAYEERGDIRVPRALGRRRSAVPAARTWVAVSEFRREELWQDLFRVLDHCELR